MPQIRELLPSLNDPDELELREQAARLQVSVRVSARERFKRGGLPIEIYAAKRPGRPLLRAFSNCGEALDWLVAGRQE